MTYDGIHVKAFDRLTSLRPTLFLECLYINMIIVIRTGEGKAVSEQVSH
jgi:hypothetical protein